MQEKQGTPLVGFTGVRKWSSIVSAIETVAFRDNVHSTAG